MNRRLALRALVLSSALASTAGASSTRAAAPAVIRFGIASPATGSPPGIGGSFVAISHARGDLARDLAAQGIKVEWVFFKGAGPAVNEALANGQLDFAWQGDFPSMLGKASGIDTKILLAAGVRQNVYLVRRPDAPIASLQDLKGKRVALFKGTNLQLAVGKLLEAHGLGERDVRFVNLDNKSAHAALVAGDLDAAFGSFELLELARRNLAPVVYSSKGGDLRVTKHTHVLVTTAFEKAHAPVVRAVVESLLRTAAWSSDEQNRDEIFRLWSRAGLPYDVWKQELDGVPLEVQSSPHFDGFLLAHYKESAATALRLRLIRRPIDVEAWVDRRHLDGAIAKLGLERAWPRFDGTGRALARR